MGGFTYDDTTTLGHFWVYASEEAIYMKMTDFFILFQIKLIITKKGFALSLVLKLSVFTWNSEMAYYCISKSRSFGYV